MPRSTCDSTAGFIGCKDSPDHFREFLDIRVKRRHSFKRPSTDSTARDREGPHGPSGSVSPRHAPGILVRSGVRHPAWQVPNNTILHSRARILETPPPPVCDGGLAFCTNERERVCVSALDAADAEPRRMRLVAAQRSRQRICVAPVTGTRRARAFTTESPPRRTFGHTCCRLVSLPSTFDNHSTPENRCNYSRGHVTKERARRSPSGLAC